MPPRTRRGEAERQPEFKYDRAKRSLEIRLSLDDSASYRNVVIELLEGIAATDGAKLKPWQIDFLIRQRNRNQHIAALSIGNA